MTGVRIELDYDANGRIVSATLLKGVTSVVDRVSYTYDETDPGILIGFAEEEGLRGEYQYDECRRLVSFPAIGAGWGNNSNRYDDAGRLIEQIVQGGRTLFAYDESARRTYVTNQVHDVQTGEHLRNQVQVYQLDGNKRIIRRVTQLGQYLDPEGGEDDDLVTEYDYDPVTGAVLSRHEQGLGEPRADFDEFGRPILITMSNSANEVISSHMNYSANGQLVDRYSSSSLAPGKQFNRESWQYDDQGRMVIHDRVGTDGSIRRTLREYEDTAEEGHTETVTRPDGSRGRLEYDGQGNLVRFSSLDDPSFEVQYAYDDHGRLIHHVDALGGVHGWAYDSLGNMVRRTDPLGREDRFTYENGRLIQEERGRGQDEPGQLIRYAYDEHGNRSAITHGDENQVLRRFGYDSDGRMVWEEDAAGMQTRYEYDAAGRILVQQDRYGVRTTNRYDAAGRLVGWADSAGRRQDLMFDEFDRVTTAVDDAGTDWEQSTSWIYDEAGRVSEESQSGGGSTRYEYTAHGEIKAIHKDGQPSEYYAYDSAGRPVTYSNEAGRVIFRSYDVLGRIQEIRDGTQGVLQRYTYDANDNLTSLTDPNGHVVYYRYDAAGQLLAQSNPDDPETDSVTYEYTAAGQLRRRTNANGTWTELFYDGSGQVTQRLETATAPWGMQYDGMGNLIEMVWPDGGSVVNEYFGDRLIMARARTGDETYLEYDPMGRIIRETGPFGETEYERDGRGFPRVMRHGGRQISWTYDAHGRLRSETRPDGAQVILEYDDDGQLVRRSGDAVLETLYEYDRFGQLSRMEDGREEYVAYTRDDWGRVVEKAYSDGTFYGYAYDGMGRRVLRQQRSGREETLTYSPAGSWTGLVCGTERHAWIHDAAGQLIRIESGAETNRWSYDEAGRIAKTVQERSGTTNTYEYNGYGQLAAVTYAGYRTAFSYDTGGRVIGVSNLLGEFHYEWDSQVPRIGQIAYPCRAVISNTYDAIGLLVKREHRKAGGAVVWSCEYAHDAMGRRTNELFGDGSSKQFIYDRRGQLVYGAACGDTGAIEQQYHYAYDAGGNRTSAVENASVSACEMGPVHRYDRYSIDGVTNTATYDANGNPTNDGRFVYKWDDLNRLSAVIDGSSRTEYDYDGLNRKVERRDYEGSECIQTLRYLYDGNRLAGLMDDSGRMRKLFLWGIDAKGNISAQGAIGGLLATIYDPGTPGEKIRYHLEDERGSLRQRLDEAGDLWDVFDYEPWGALSAAFPEDMESVPLWHGKARETMAGLYDFGYRHYHARWGRWLNPDPAGEVDGLNLYRFAGNDPVNHTDAKGLVLVAFDGTWNDKDDPTSDATNVGRMHDMYKASGAEAIYVKGPAGLMGGATGKDPDYDQDFKTMLAQLESVLTKAKRAGKQEPIDIIGFSRGACRANSFARYLEKYGLMVDGECVNPRIRFMGLYDRVCAKGLPGNTWDPGEDKGIPGNVNRIVHLVSEHERRPSFMSNRFCDPRHEGFCPSFITEIVVPGVHSDIGGGYSNKIGQALFNMGKMLELAREAGVREWPGELPREYAEIVERESRQFNMSLNWHDSCDSTHSGTISCGTIDSPRTVDFSLPFDAAISALNWRKTHDGLSDSRLVGVKAGLRGGFEMLPDGTYKMRIGDYWYTDREARDRGWLQ
jgi:RHS repeat-associated protein